MVQPKVTNPDTEGNFEAEPFWYGDKWLAIKDIVSKCADWYVEALDLPQMNDMQVFLSRGTMKKWSLYVGNEIVEMILKKRELENVGKKTKNHEVYL